VELLERVTRDRPEFEAFIKEVRIPDGLSPFYADERQMCQMVSILLENAFEAIDDGKEQALVTLSAENTTLEDPKTVEEFAIEPGNYVRITVEDNGKGISPDNLDKIFDPYFSTKNSVTQKGLGLGLALCYSIIKKHKGHIQVDSAEGKGTKVTFYLPASPDGDQDRSSDENE
jgi:signal transduction histidine kinase